MTGDIFRDWLQKWNQKLLSQKRTILLVIDNCTAHPRNLELSNINIKFLPPNTTAKLQPCDQGIIQSLKVHYRHQLVKRLLLSMESGEDLKISMLDAMQWLKIAWDKVTAEIIRNCFQHCNFRDITSSVCMDLVSEPSSELENLFEGLKSHNVNIEGSVEDYTHVDDDVAIDGVFTDSDIVSMIQDDAVLSEEPYIACDDEPIACPTISEFRDALDIVRRFVTCKTDTNSHLNSIAELEELLLKTSTKIYRQTSLTDFC